MFLNNFALPTMASLLPNTQKAIPAQSTIQTKLEATVPIAIAFSRVLTQRFAGSSLQSKVILSIGVSALLSLQVVLLNTFSAFWRPSSSALPFSGHICLSSLLVSSTLTSFHVLKVYCMSPCHDFGVFINFTLDPSSPPFSTVIPRQSESSPSPWQTP